MSKYIHALGGFGWIWIAYDISGQLPSLIDQIAVWIGCVSVAARLWDLAIEEWNEE